MIANNKIFYLVETSAKHPNFPELTIKITIEKADSQEEYEEKTKNLIYVGKTGNFDKFKYDPTKRDYND